MKPVSNIIIGIIGVLVLASPVLSQNLQTAWEQYLDAETRYQALHDREQEFAQQQEQLLQKQRKLQDRQAWYNGWIVKIQLSGISDEVIEVADSLHRIRIQLQRAEQLKAERFQQFKQLYLAQSENRQASEAFEEHWLGRSDLIIRSIATGSNLSAALPDYTEIVNRLYEGEETKRLVLSDLQTVITEKIGHIDSLLTSRQSDLALLRSMSDFRKDVRLQTQSDADLSRSKTETAGGSREISTGTFPNFSDAEDTKAAEQYPVETNAPGQSSAPGEVNMETVRGDIQRLEMRRNQYHKLLETIQKELDH